MDSTQCPRVQESSVGKIAHEGYLRAHMDLTHFVAIKLRDMRWDPPECGGDTGDGARCLERDRALNERQHLNQRQVACVYEAFGPTGSVKGAAAQWYEPLRIRSVGGPVPIGTSFAVLATSWQIDNVAKHPYVERVEPAFGEAQRIGVSAPSIPTECPSPQELPEPKIVDVASIKAEGRQPVVVELRQDLLPSLRPCQNIEQQCDDFFWSGWERTIVGRRMQTCVSSWIDSKLEGPAPNVTHSSADGIPAGPKLPPFGDSIHAALSFGLGLTWEEVFEAAKHPYVERLWTSSDLTIGNPPIGCPRDYSVPVEPPACPTVTEAMSGKYTPSSQSAWESSSGANEVIIAVRRNNELCPRPLCPGRAVGCPELERHNSRLLEEARASQTCVRALIVAIGGTVSPEVLTLGNALPATLTWAQIQTVATHPHVIQIDRRYEGTPPP